MRTAAVLAVGRHLPMTPEQRERCTALGKVFRARGMGVHLEDLRKLYTGQPTNWMPDFVDHWLALLQLPPFETRYQLLEHGAHRCRPTPAVRTVTVWPGPEGWDGTALFQCVDCGAQWLEHFGRPAARTAAGGGA